MLQDIPMRIASEHNDDEVERNVRAIKVLADEERWLQRVRDAIKYVVNYSMRVFF